MKWALCTQDTKKCAWKGILFNAIPALETKEDCCRFFEDLCTVNELISLSQSFEAASMFTSHKTYPEIAEETGASTAPPVVSTIPRITATRL
jgi:TrpR-related protein YerC/YecD